MSLKTIILSILALLVVGLVMLNVFANHAGNYLAADPDLQFGTANGDSSGLPELYSPEKWVLANATSTSIRWYATSTKLVNYTRTAQIHHLTVERASATLVVGWMGSQLAVSVLIRWSRKPEMGPKAVSRPISAVVGHSAASAPG